MSFLETLRLFKLELNMLTSLGKSLLLEIACLKLAMYATKRAPNPIFSICVYGAIDCMMLLSWYW